jgi:benzoyl-CoA reductase/2-hydroxyglutaryl-CoA dehydratase subunit BcrC/BadD/HgdB
MSDPAPSSDSPDPLAWFADMVDHCCDFADAAKARRQPVVGILCEFTPREIILAAGAVPVCLCGGSAATIHAAEQFLPANLCPLIKSTFGYHVKGTNPFLNQADLVVGETTCDGKKKMFELMGATRPMYVLELPQKADDADALARWTHEVRKFKDYLELRFQTRITDEKLRGAIRLMNRERNLRRQLAALMISDNPPITGRQLITLKSIISGIEADLEQYERALRLYGSAGAISPSRCGPAGEPGIEHQTPNADPRTECPNPLPSDIPCPTFGDRCSSQDQGGEPDRVRVLLTGVPLVHGAERVLELVENCGATVVCMENCTGLKPILEDVDADDPDPLLAIARKYYHLPCSVLTLNAKRLETLRALAARFRPQCVIELVWQACLTYDIESFHVRKLAEDQLRLPYLKITTDYSPSDSARITARVEALVEMVRSRKISAPRT